MPVVLGPFETSLRGGDSPSVDRRVLHKGCCGDVHGHGVKKERSGKEKPKATRSCSHPGESSSDESYLFHHSPPPPDLLMSGNNRRLKIGSISSRSQSSDCTPLRVGYGKSFANVNKRSSSAVVAQRLFSSPTKATTAKVRAERTASDGRAMSMEVQKMTNRGQQHKSLSYLPRKVKITKSIEEPDSGHFSSDTEPINHRFLPTIPSSEQRRQSLISGMSDDELSMEELRLKQRRERRDYLQLRQHSPKTNSGSMRKQSPSPAGHRNVRYGDRGRRSSDESLSGESSSSPPITILLQKGELCHQEVFLRNPVLMEEDMLLVPAQVGLRIKRI